MLFVNVEVVLAEDEIAELGEGLENYVKAGLRSQIGQRVADSEIGLQRYINVNACKWSQRFYVLDDAEYKALRGGAE